MSRETITHRVCTRVVYGTRSDGADDVECIFNGDVEAEVFNEAGPYDADVTWICPLCGHNHLERL